MYKVFRLHDGADGSGWFDSTSFSDEQLETIKTDGKAIANSIPSPFARMDLVNDAFKWVTRNGVNGASSYHRLVSEALDIGQLFFITNKYPSILEVKEYNLNSRLSELFGGSDSRHKNLAETINTYKNQDKYLYNFDKVDVLYFLFHNKELIGATSPRCLFFSATLSKKLRISISIEGSNGKFLSNKSVPLHQREWSFIEYLYLLSKTEKFSANFPELYSYLDKAIDELDEKKRLTVLNLSVDKLGEYEKMHVAGQPSNYCQIIHTPLLLEKQNIVEIERSSDFVIQPDYEIEGMKPLVLPNDNFSESWVYTTPDIKWRAEDFRGKVPYVNESSLENSKLPVQNDLYPWLTSGNFFADKLIKLPYQIDKNKFSLPEKFTGYEYASNYLIPLTDTYFTYFDASSVSRNLRIKELNQGSVEAQLTIKVKAGQIVFRKTYVKNDIEIPQIHLAILPFIKVGNEIPIEYYIGLIDDDVKKNDSNTFSITGFYQGKKVNTSPPIQRGPGRPLRKTLYWKADRYFDSLKFTFNNNITGYIIPNMKEYKIGVDKCTYAIDFGTTNTHIEYKINNDAERAFDISKENPLWVSLLDDSIETAETEKYRSAEESFSRELFPMSIGNSELVNFPLRTALVKNSQGIDINKEIEVLRHVNNYLLYENMHHGGYLTLLTELKWSNLHDRTNKIWLNSYFKNITFLILYKSISLGIPLENIFVKWFYPTSMGTYHRHELDNAWKRNIIETFHSKIPENNLQSLPESIGPYIYYFKKYSIPGLTASIDIGGGSTDISVYNQNKTELICSFRFAGNNLYGDGYGVSPDKNGFINAFTKDVKEYLKSNNIKNNILNDIIETRQLSHDFSSYLFSLSKNSKSFDYSDLIKSHQYIKLSVVIFHFAIAYYLGKLLQHSSLTIPKNILFSGSASKSIELIDSSEELDKIASIYNYMISKILKQKELKTMKCELSQIPKQITCKGGLLTDEPPVFQEEQVSWVGGAKKYDSIFSNNGNNEINMAYENVNNDVQEDIILSIKHMYDQIDNYFEKLNIETEFGIDRRAYDVFKNIRMQNTHDYLRIGIEKAIRDNNNDKRTKIQETLFFYPLIQELSNLTYELSKKKR